MNWVTRCPSCGATYRVVSDQLKIAQGWLRCGRCRQAFDSTGMVLDWTNARTPVLHEETAEHRRVPIEDLLKQEDRSPLDSSTMTALTSFEEALATFSPQPLPPLQRDGLSESSIEQMTPSAESGMRKTRSWMSRLGVLSLLLALGLQWLWIGRHELLAVQMPVVTGTLHTLCRVAGCEILPMQVRDGVVMDSSSLTPHEDGLLLRWSVRNVTAHALQMPALELMLLDAHDKPLVRRVFSVDQQGAPYVLAAAQMWTGELRLLPVPDLSPAGYRVISFYP